MITQLPWLTVVTVVKDDPAAFARTAESLQIQRDAGMWEWIVIDSSQDTTEIATIVHSHPLIGDTPVRVDWCAPRGVYPAMNTAVGLAAGDFVLFLNAGDTLIADDVLTRVHEVVQRHEPRWLFGPVEIVQIDGVRVRTPPWDVATERRACFARGHFPPHQGTFARRADVLAAGGFDPRYAIAADYAMFLELALISDPLQLDFPVAVFVEGGLSTQRWRQSFREFHAARRAILAPRGMAAWRERFETIRHYAAVSAYRTLRSVRERIGIA